MEQQNNKNKWLHLRLSEDEYKQIQRQFKKTTCRKVSEYARNKLLERHLTAYYRNQSLDDFMTETIRLREALNMVGNNFNQAVRKLNSMRPDEDVKRWATIYELAKNDAIEMITEIKDRIKIFAEKWLQDSTQGRP